MFEADHNRLPASIAHQLKILMQGHIGLRAYYPAIEQFYESVRSGHQEAPLPPDQVASIIQDVRDNAPKIFEPNVVDTLDTTARPIPEIPSSNVDENSNVDLSRPTPPPDPFGEVETAKAKNYQLAGILNALWKTVLDGEKLDKRVEGWSKVIAAVGPKVAEILDWLRISQ